MFIIKLFLNKAQRISNLNKARFGCPLAIKIQIQCKQDRESQCCPIYS